MINFEYLIKYTGYIVDVEFYYALIEKEDGVMVRLREEVMGSEETFGPYKTKEEAMNFVKEYKKKVEKLAKLEEELF